MSLDPVVRHMVVDLPWTDVMVDTAHHMGQINNSEKDHYYLEYSVLVFRGIKEIWESAYQSWRFYHS